MPCGLKQEVFLFVCAFPILNCLCKTCNTKEWNLQGLIYINYNVEDNHSRIRLFEDDTSLYIIVDRPQQAANSLNADLAKIHLWPLNG